jgi:carbonic anhydrase
MGMAPGACTAIREMADLQGSQCQRIRSHPLVPGHIPIYGYYYDVKTGRLVEVPEATAAGKAKS